MLLVIVLYDDNDNDGIVVVNKRFDSAALTRDSDVCVPFVCCGS